jgi:tRNA (cmo5U34)-methyltransferase
MGRMDQWHTEETATGWDSGEGDELPTRAEQQEILLALLATTPIDDGAVLDLGVGSGLVAEAVLDRLPDAHLVGIDFSDAMLQLARRRLARFEPRATVLRGDLSELDKLELPRVPYRAAFSVQTMHHLSGRDWADAVKWTANLVEPGGLIVIVDRVQIAERLFGDWAVVWSRIDSRVPETYTEHLEELTAGGDRPTRLHDQLRWLHEAGLEADCLHLYGNRALLVARKPNYVRNRQPDSHRRRFLAGI